MGFVVKNGSNRCLRASAEMPTPLSMTRQRIAGVQNEIENRLLDLRGIDAHDRRFRSENEGQRDVLPNQARQHPLQAADRLVEVDVLREKHLLPAEGEQLL